MGADISTPAPKTFRLGTRVSKLNNTVYQPATAGQVTAMTGTATDLLGYTDGNADPTGSLVARGHREAVGGQYGGLTFDVKKDDYWKVVGADNVFWIPFEYDY
ncbi:MAG: hypothetical protein FVQ79_09610 [Planctomycetes bacterium]|nr:hypothetical protein [Planctomycetota bacterium]